MARHVHLLPGRERAEQLAQDLLVLLSRGRAISLDISSGCAAEAWRSSAMRRSSSTRPLLALDDQIVTHASGVLQQPRQRIFEVAPVDDHVDRALLEQETLRSGTGRASVVGSFAR